MKLFEHKTSLLNEIETSDAFPEVSCRCKPMIIAPSMIRAAYSEPEAALSPVCGIQ